MNTIKSYIPWVLGFSLLYSLNTVFFYEKWVIVSVNVEAVLPYGLALNGSLCLAALIIVVAYKISKRGYQTGIFWGGALLYALGLAFQYLTITHCNVSTSLLLSGVCSGLGVGLLTSLWFSMLAKLPGKSFAYVLGTGSLASTALGLCIGLVEQPFLLLVGSCSLFASLVILRSCMKKSPELASLPKTESRKDAAAQVKTGEATQTSPLIKKRRFFSQVLFPALSVCMLSIVYCVLDAVALQSISITPEATRLASQLGGFIAAAVFLLIIRFDTRFSHTTILNAVFVVLATGLLLLPFTPDPYSVILNVIAAAGWETALLIVFYSVITYAKDNKLEVLPSFGATYALPRLGFVVGIILFLIIGANEGYAFAELAMVSFLCLYLIILVSLFANSYMRKRAEGSLTRTTKLLSHYEKGNQDVFLAACTDVAEKHFLTKRETEVLGHIAQGRDIDYISEALIISKNTVKGYRKDIYTKLGIHSRQEVIDLVKTTIEEAKGS